MGNRDYHHDTLGGYPRRAVKKSTRAQLLHFAAEPHFQQYIVGVGISILLVAISQRYWKDPVGNCI